MTALQGLRMALAALGAHKLRSALTLVGIVAGVASIIAIMTGISVVQAAMEKELSVLGTTTFQVQKWPPRGFGNRDGDWRRIQLRAPLTASQADAVREGVDSVDLVGAELWRFGVRATYRDSSTENNLWVVGGTPEYPENNTHLVRLGRNITNEDVTVSRAVGVIGHAVAQELFPFIDPVGQTIRIGGRKITVQGVFEEKKSAMGGNFDNYVLIPITVFEQVWGGRDGDGRRRSVNITVRAVSPDRIEDAIDETRMVLRRVRGVPPGEEDDFEIFTNDSQIKAFNQATASVKLGAFVLGTIGLVVAGIGIMNIMLVSVTERTREIGIRKALGARRRDILLQFLLEAVVLCNVGGVIGVAVGFGLGNLVSAFTDFAVHIPTEWVIRGLGFCTTVAVLFGTWPAVRASRLAPIESLRFE
jgi:putative ABC transport system permease protein